MFCEECGSKLKKEAIFCEECGTKATKTKSKPQEEISIVKEKPEKKKATIKTKIFLGTIIVLALIFYFVSTMFTPEKAVLKYIECTLNYESCFVDYLDIKEDEFFSKKDLDTFLIEQLKSSKEKDEVRNYQVTKVKDYKNGKYDVTVKFTFKDKQTKEHIFYIKESENKNLFLFPKFILETDDIWITTNFEIVAPKDAKVLLDDVEIKKYKEEDGQKSIYTIPVVINKEHKIRIEMNDLVFESKTTNNYNFYESMQLTDETETKISDLLKNEINNIYTDVISNKDFDQEKYNSSLNDDYNQLKKSIQYYKSFQTELKKLEIESFEISTSNIKKNNIIEIYGKMNYIYSSTSSYDNTENEKSYNFVTIEFDLVTKKVVGFSSMPAYF